MKRAIWGLPFLVLSSFLVACSPSSVGATGAGSSAAALVATPTMATNTATATATGTSSSAATNTSSSTSTNTTSATATSTASSTGTSTSNYPTPANASNFSATAADYYGISLSWTVVSGSPNFVGYTFAYQEGTTPPADCSNGTNVGNGASAGVGNLKPGTQYSFRLCSYAGYGNPNSSYSPGLTTTVSTPSARIATAISAGNFHACALTNVGTVFCWGANDYGQLGNNVTSPNWSYSPVQVVGPGGTGFLSGIIAISSGSRHTCALSSSNNVYCWGDNTNGNLGIGSTTQMNYPVQVAGAGGLGITAIAAGTQSTCSLASTGSVFCWGQNDYGQLGNNSRNLSTTPVQVVGVNGVGVLANITAISSGGNGIFAHNCAISSVGNIYCWGSNEYGTNYGNDWTTAPVEILTNGNVVPLNNIIGISVGVEHDCALSSSGNTWCWGADDVGQLGNNRKYSLGVSLPPMETFSVGAAFAVGGGATAYLSGINLVSAGNGSSFAVDSIGNAYCWGDNSYGQLGIPSTAQQITPILSGFTNVVSITQGSGWAFTCALTKTGEIYCSGANNWGQLGNLSNYNEASPVGVYSFSTTFSVGHP